jgi:hypothetical protein
MIKSTAVLCCNYVVEVVEGKLEWVKQKVTKALGDSGTTTFLLDLFNFNAIANIVRNGEAFAAI